MKNDLPMLRYTCPKCGSKEYSLSEIRVAGSVFSGFSSFGHRVFTTVTCSRCKYTELYKMPLRKIAEAFSFQSIK